MMMASCRLLIARQLRSLVAKPRSCPVRRYSLQGATATNPEIYNTAPGPIKIRKPGQLSQQQVEQFFQDGFLLVPRFFTNDEMQAVVEAVEECVDILADKLYRGGKITDKCEKAGFYQRLWMLEQQFKGSAVILHKLGYLPPGFRALWSNERLLNIVEQLIGPNIAGHPVWNLRTKTPQNEQTTVPWHQDNAYLDPSSLNTLQPTAWIPLLDATVETGCMQIVKGGHRLGKTATHTCCAGGTWYVDLEEKEMETSLGVDLKKDIVTCEVPFGGMLLLNNCIPHRSLENYSDKVRWSLDLRWQDPMKPNGFHDLKECILMRKEGDPDYKIQWEGFAALDRTMLQNQAMGVSSDEFDTSIHGPWMKRWSITHHNKHTQSMEDNKGSSWHAHS